ncbi:hypothetical protein Srot_1949 [Segniliparus rotundus DSM 44985]|uniref:Lipoprotein n=1 Tax=Segniliparus rotundus (strain ATCC BAA-972 / CDC 1076 / CIP 108378 / DSM 44985 / JCM 13578) TaxID=640132 RepID=D6Z8X6_SEGRD|nr:hypothetical protein [Segniliparus rotundus]ADG98406.1 hypothetical protein Srot_1949 [Segniliparus rotundus DSM 44985]
MPHLTLKHTAAVLLVGGLALSGCQRGNTGGATTIIQQPATNTANSTSASPDVSAVNDGKELCTKVRVKARELINATDVFWKYVLAHPGVDRTDEQLNKYIDKVTEVAGKDIPALKGVVGPSAPKEQADAVRKFTESAQDFTDSISGGSANDSRNAKASAFQDSIDGLNAACPG